MPAKKGSFIAVRLTDAQKALLVARADESGLSVSEYVRHLVLNALGIIK